MTPTPTGRESGKFVSFEGQGGDFLARWKAETSTIRVRTHHGAAELNQMAEGCFSGDGYGLVSAGGVTTPGHAGKVDSKNCKRVSPVDDGLGTDRLAAGHVRRKRLIVGYFPIFFSCHRIVTAAV
jgi:hypothetical protein